MAQAVATRDMLAESGHNMEILSGASTGTYNIDADIEGVSELQAGSYIFMDVEYRRIGGSSGAVYDDFQPALSVLATVVHRSGSKAISSTRGCFISGLLHGIARSDRSPCRWTRRHL